MQPEAAAALTDALLTGGEEQMHIPTTDSSDSSKLGIIVNRQLIKLLTNRMVSNRFCRKLHCCLSYLWSSVTECGHRTRLKKQEGVFILSLSKTGYGRKVSSFMNG